MQLKLKGRAIKDKAYSERTRGALLLFTHLFPTRVVSTMSASAMSLSGSDALVQPHPPNTQPCVVQIVSTQPIALRASPNSDDSSNVIQYFPTGMLITRLDQIIYPDQHNPVESSVKFAMVNVSTDDAPIVGFMALGMFDTSAPLGPTYYLLPTVQAQVAETALIELQQRRQRRHLLEQQSRQQSMADAALNHTLVTANVATSAAAAVGGAGAGATTNGVSNTSYSHNNKSKPKKKHHQRRRASDTDDDSGDSDTESNRRTVSLMSLQHPQTYDMDTAGNVRARPRLQCTTKPLRVAEASGDCKSHSTKRVVTLKAQ